MAMWLRLAGVLLITAAAMATLDHFGLRSDMGFRPAEDAQHGRLRGLFWLAIFALVMAMALVAAMRRWAGHARRAAVIARSGRRDVP